jgi:hypothetical protein
MTSTLAHDHTGSKRISPALTGDEANEPGWRTAEIPAANALGLAAIRDRRRVPEPGRLTRRAGAVSPR